MDTVDPMKAGDDIDVIPSRIVPPRIVALDSNLLASMTFKQPSTEKSRFTIAELRTAHFDSTENVSAVVTEPWMDSLDPILTDSRIDIDPPIVAPDPQAKV